MTGRNLRALADALELEFMTDQDRKRWVQDLRAHAKCVEVSVMCATAVRSGGERPNIKQLCQMYDAYLASAGEPEKADTTRMDLYSLPKLRHLRWMLSVIPTLPDAEKANRWLGFVQGVLFAMDFYSIDELRRDVAGAHG